MHRGIPYARSADFQSASPCELTRPVTFAPKRPLTTVASAVIPGANLAPGEYARSADFQSASPCELTRPVTFAPKRPITTVATALIPAANLAPCECGR